MKLGLIEITDELEAKKYLLRSIRDDLLYQTDRVFFQIMSEKIEVEDAIPGAKEKYTAAQRKTFLKWRRDLKDLPKTIDLSGISLESIHSANNEIFGVMPDFITL